MTHTSAIDKHSRCAIDHVESRAHYILEDWEWEEVISAASPREIYARELRAWCRGERLYYQSPEKRYTDFSSFLWHGDCQFAPAFDALPQIMLLSEKESYVARKCYFFGQSQSFGHVFSSGFRGFDKNAESGFNMYEVYCLFH